MDLKPLDLKLDIVYEDEYLMVVDKPTGLVVHAGAGNKDNTLVNALINYTNNLSKKDICVSTNKPGEICSSIMAIYNDLDRSKSCMRISLSHMTTVLEVNRFLEVFEVEYNKLKDI